MRVQDSQSQQTLGKWLTIVHIALLVQFALELFSGIVLSLAYRTSEPFESVTRLHSSWLKPLQGFHYWTSSLVILEGSILIVALIWTGRFHSTFRLTYFSTLLVFLCSLGFQITGNVLPNDQHGVQTAVIESAISARVPLVGSQLRQVSLGGSQFSAHTISLWYDLHASLSVIAVLALILAFAGRRSYRRHVSNATVAGFICPGFLLGLFVSSPLGDKASAADYSGFADKASWYTWPLHGALVMTSRVGPSFGWIGAIAVPTIAVLFVFALPFIKRSPLAIGKSGICCIVVFFGVSALFFGGSFDSLVGKRDPVATNTAAHSDQAEPINRSLALAGIKQFNSSGCSSCHGAGGLAGGAGPSLTQTYKSHPDAVYYEKYINNPQAVDANSTMPAFPLGSEKLREIAEYLRSPEKPSG